MNLYVVEFAAALFLCGLLWLVFRYGIFLPADPGLPILLYHKVSTNHEDALTISTDRLDRELAYIKSSGYTPISFAELKESLDARRALPAKPVIITFDDAYLSTYEFAWPLLVKHAVKATVFVPTALTGSNANWAGANEALMTWEIMRKLAQSQPAGSTPQQSTPPGPLLEFGMHSHRHESYEHYSGAQIEADLSDCLRTLEAGGCPFTRVFAYAYGRMPRDPSADRAMREFFRRHEIAFAVRIGSRINSLPPKDVYALKRTAIRGTDSFREFKIKLRKGRSKLF